MKDSSKTLLAILGILALVFVLNPQNHFLGSSLNTVNKPVITIQRVFSVSSGSGVLNLPPGMVVANVVRVHYAGKLCGMTTTLVLDGHTLQLVGGDCAQQYFADSSGQQAYEHYSEQDVSADTTGTGLINPSYTITRSNVASITYGTSPAPSANILDEQVILEEKVECDRNSQCVNAAPYCNQNTHTCQPSVNTCTNDYAPVCATLGGSSITYTNPCYATLAGASVQNQGSCTTPASTTTSSSPGIVTGTLPPSQPSNTNISLLITAVLAVVALLIIMNIDKIIGAFKG